MRKRRYRKRRKIRRIFVPFLRIILVGVVFLLGFQILSSLHNEPVIQPEQPQENVILVNSTHALPQDYQVDLVDLYNGEQVSKEMYPELQQMFDEMRMEGYAVSVRSGYRSYQTQQEIMDNQIAEYVQQGYDEQTAAEMAKQWVSVPGYSEHQTGLCIDIDSASRGIEEDYQVYAWLARHAVDYGFILRYPEGKQDITGISYEPWHYRYVGKSLAKKITERGITLEEYLGQ